MYKMPLLRQEREKLQIHGFNRVKSQKVTTESRKKKISKSKYRERCDVFKRGNNTQKNLMWGAYSFHNLACL